ncbi:KUP/HAK/KT family potassium transporter [Candidatus Roizmanbacteria bacterium]|nr:KUP/HAK/KT family potassium transporter [Candidatus Roizmanbacteria bacterium]
MKNNTPSKKDYRKIFLLSLSTLGVVYGDIGTSPLYAVNTIFFNHTFSHINRLEILGSLSLIIWILTLAICIKYIFFVLKADNDGAGGVFALYGLIHKLRSKSKLLLTPLLIIGAGLLLGDGIITPAISVISAVEGLKVATNIFVPYIIPLTLLILTGLFIIQSKGTGKIGSFFGPIVIVWFFSIAALGFMQIIRNPEILTAVNPLYALSLLSSVSLKTILLIFGAVILVITGGEAMYADMGHFGKLPIRLAWFLIVYPSLLLNYFGQGAYMLSGKAVIHGNIFYSMVPSFLLIPMVILATFATVIASQALISAAFSLITQAISLELFPYIRTIHTHQEHRGQIYIPFINWLLFIGAILLVIGFQSSTRLASVYGLAVAGDMFITSLCMTLIARSYWKWPHIKTILIFGVFVGIDGILLLSNSIKLIAGGFIPISIGLFILLIMKTWQWGRKQITSSFMKYDAITLNKLIHIKEKNSMFIPQSIIIMTPSFIHKMHGRVPTLKQLFLDRYGLLPKHLIFLTVAIENKPFLHNNRYEVKKLYDDSIKGSITSVLVRFGYMEDPEVESLIEGMAQHEKINIEIDPSKWLIHVMHERIRPARSLSFLNKVRFHLFKIILRNTESADHYYGLGIKQGLSIETLPVVICAR